VAESGADGAARTFFNEIIAEFAGRGKLIGAWNGSRKAAGVSWTGTGGGRDCSDGDGEDESSIGAAAGGFFISGKKYDGVFSTGYFGGGECGVVGCVVFGEPVAAVKSHWPSLLSGPNVYPRRLAELRF